MTNGTAPHNIAARQGHLPVVQLLDREAAVNLARTNGATPLFIAALEGHLPVVQLLLDHDAAVDHAVTNGAKHCTSRQNRAKLA